MKNIALFTLAKEGTFQLWETRRHVLIELKNGVYGNNVEQGAWITALYY